MICINTYDGCQNPPTEIVYRVGYQERITKNFCSDKCRKLYRGEIKLKTKTTSNRNQSLIHPDRKDWIVKIGNLTYIYDPWHHKYYLYKQGTGLLNDLDTVVADENSEYYRTLLDIINRELPVPQQQPNKPFPKKYNKLVALGIDEKTISQIEKRLPTDHYICHVCGKVLIVTGGKVTNLLLCPRCGWDIKGKGYERNMEQQTNKQNVQQSTSSKRFSKQKQIKSRRQTK